MAVVACAALAHMRTGRCAAVPHEKKGHARCTGTAARRPASADIDDDLVLTPNHFLYPYLFVSDTSLVLPPQAEKRSVLRHGWKCSQFLLDDFWRRFSTEYVQELLKRNKKTTTPIGVNSLVLVEDVEASRENWKIGRVTEILNQDKNHGKRFLIRLASGKTVDRHISSLVILEV